MNLFKEMKLGPQESDAIRKGIIATILTNSLLFGWLFARRTAKYDFSNRRLK